MKFLKALKLAFQLLHCLTCAHNQECPFSMIANFKNTEYIITVKKRGDE